MAAEMGHVAKAIIGWVGTPLLVIFVAAIVLHSVGPAVVSAGGGGVPGTFTADRHTCAPERYGTSCFWTGSFVGDDGTRLAEVNVPDAPRGGRPPVVLRLVWDGSLDPVNLRPQGRDPLPLIVITMFALLSTAAVVGWAVALERTIRGRRWPGWVIAMQRLARWR